MPRLGRASAKEVDGGETPMGDPEAHLFEDLSAARLPGRLTVGLHDAAGDRPAGLVRRLGDEEATSAVEEESARRGRDPGQLEGKLVARVHARCSHRPGRPPGIRGDLGPFSWRVRHDALRDGAWRGARRRSRRCTLSIGQPGREDLLRWRGASPSNYYDASPNLARVFALRAGPALLAATGPQPRALRAGGGRGG